MLTDIKLDKKRRGYEKKLREKVIKRGEKERSKQIKGERKRETGRGNPCTNVLPNHVYQPLKQTQNGIPHHAVFHSVPLNGVRPAKLTLNCVF